MKETSRGRWLGPLLGERDLSVWTLLLVVLGPPIAWSLHFLLIYFLVALYCSTGWAGGKMVIGIVTIPFVAMALIAGWVGRREWKRLRREQEWFEAAAEPGHWAVFLLVMGVFEAVLFTALIVSEAAPIFFAPLCVEVAG